MNNNLPPNPPRGAFKFLKINKSPLGDLGVDLLEGSGKKSGGGIKI